MIKEHNYIHYFNNCNSC